MEAILSRHPPLITQRIQFQYAQALQPALITPRINFIDSWVSGQDSRSVTEDNGFDACESPARSQADQMVIPDDGESELLGSDAEEDEEPPRSFHGLISKPPGEPGRPNSGGYNLECSLRGWTPKMFSDVSLFVKGLADAKLDMAKSYSRQNASAIKSICEATTQQYSILTKYENCWPVRDILKLHLKYRVETSRKHDKFRKKGATETQAK